MATVAELDISDDHPLALELASLRTTVDRFQVRYTLPNLLDERQLITRRSLKPIIHLSNFNGTLWILPTPTSVYLNLSIKMHF